MNVILSILKEDVGAFKMAVSSAGLKSFPLEGTTALSDIFDEFRIEYGHPRSLFMLGKQFEISKCKIERAIELKEIKEQFKSLI